MFAESRRLRMFNGGLVLCSMRLGVPFIAPRQLGAVGSPFGRQFSPSVGWRTGQSGAPPDMNNVWFLSFFGEANRWALGPLGTPDSVWCIPDSPVWPGDRWLWPRVTCWPRCRPLAWALLAHRTVQCTPDSSVNYSRSALGNFPRAASLLLDQPVHRTLSGAPQAGANFSNLISFDLTRILALRRIY
jgi:hypothetical protein